ncbi:MAG TPA: hypothetical protein VHX88_10485 [Solirubrobacteraceae bacterium]|jgi:hypothetical protein|nr:hypothetical protein [Solirubrobacteraceae bacterium]
MKRVRPILIAGAGSLALCASALASTSVSGSWSGKDKHGKAVTLVIDSSVSHDKTAGHVKVGSGKTENITYSSKSGSTYKFKVSGSSETVEASRSGSKLHFTLVSGHTKDTATLHTSSPSGPSQNPIY